MLAENPAKLSACIPAKGVLAPGSDADIVVDDPKADHVIRAEDMAGAADYNPYEGFVTKGSIRRGVAAGKPWCPPARCCPALWASTCPWGKCQL